MDGQMGQVTEIPVRPYMILPAEIFLARGGVRRGWGCVLYHVKLLRTPYAHPTWLQHDISKSSPEIAPKKFDLTVILLLQGKVALQGFCAGASKP